jgi:exodeoxyribonuclease I
MMQNTILWYDYETFGLSPTKDRIAQFAAVRTDTDLNIISDDVVLYNKPTNDFVPSIEACLLTGLTPIICQKKGLAEFKFISKILALMTQPATCIAGFNNIRFDDEFTRQTLYRNLLPPYGHEWQNNNSRWDIINVVRMCAAVRPQGLQVAKDKNGKASFKLENLTYVNSIKHKSAHDAISDVFATITLAQLIKKLQPRLFFYFFNNRKKEQVIKIVDLFNHPLLVHSSGMFLNEFYNTSIVVPITIHPINKNNIICYDLRYPVDDFISQDAEECFKRIFTKQEIQEKKQQRIAIKGISVNKAPVVAPISIMQDDENLYQRISLDKKTIKQRYDTLMQNILPLQQKIKDIYNINDFNDEQNDVEESLYAGGFITDDDYQKLSYFRINPCEKKQYLFKDKRLDELCFRYKGKFYPECLNKLEQNKYQDYIKNKIDKRLYINSIEKYEKEHILDARQQKIIQDLRDYANYL